MAPVAASMNPISTAPATAPGTEPNPPSKAMVRPLISGVTPAVGLTNTTQFLRSATQGRVNLEATALSQGRTQQLWRVDITDESGRLIAHGEVRLQNVAGKP